PSSSLLAISLHDALPICAWDIASRSAIGMPSEIEVDTTTSASRTAAIGAEVGPRNRNAAPRRKRSRCAMHARAYASLPGDTGPRSEEHTSELQSRENLVC